MKNKIVILIFLSVFLLKPTPSNAQLIPAAIIITTVAWETYLILNKKIPIKVNLPDVREDKMVDMSTYMPDKQSAFNFCMEKMRSERDRLKLNPTTNTIYSFENDVFFAQIMKENEDPKEDDFLVIFKSTAEQTRTYIGKKITTPRYGYKTFFYIGSRITNAKFTINQYLPADNWGGDLVRDEYSLDFVAKSATRNTVLELDPYFDGVLEDLTIKGN